MAVWQTKLNFWIAFMCGVLVPVVLLLLWPRTVRKKDVIYVNNIGALSS